ncbi:MAG: N-acetyltransferase [Candidatus Thermoplasmatota archaeon]
MNDRQRIRYATITDLDQIYAIEQRCFPGNTAYSYRQLQYLITKAKSSCLVEEKAGRIRGFTIILFKKNSRICGLETINVDPEFQRNGIGQRLLCAAEKEMKKRGSYFCRLEVSITNKGARNFYKKNGYQDIKVLKKYYRYEHHGSCDAVRMIKKLV